MALPSYDNATSRFDGAARDEKAIDKHEVPMAHVDVASENSLTLSSILKGSAASRMTTFEKKAALINAEMDQFGMGRYQICIWFLCGFGYFLDLAWAQGVGLMVNQLYPEMGVPDDRTGLIFTLANAGLAIGALSFGILVDAIGRKWAFNLTCLICSVFGMLLAAPRYNYEAVCGLYFLASIGLGGNIPIDATITLEFLPQNRRSLVALLSLWQPVGVVFASAVSYGTVPRYACNIEWKSCRAADLEPGEPCCSVSNNMGWRYLVLILGSVTLFVFFARFFLFTFHESPKFLLSKGKEQEAIDVLHRIAKFNRAPPPTLTLEHFREIDRADGNPEVHETHRKRGVLAMLKFAVANFADSFKKLGKMFTNKIQVFTFVLLIFTYMGDYWSFNLAGSFLPIVLARHNVSTGDASITETYRQYIYIYLPGILGAVLALFSISLPLVGRKWSLVFSAAMQGLSMAMYTQVRSVKGYVGLNALEYIMQTYFNAVLYASAPELFDTMYRGSVSGMLSALGRVAGIVAPFAGQYYLANGSSGILWLGAGGIWLSALMMVFLPVEMRNRQMF